MSKYLTIWGGAGAGSTLDIKTSNTPGYAAHATIKLTNAGTVVSQGTLTHQQLVNGYSSAAMNAGDVVGIIVYLQYQTNGTSTVTINASVTQSNGTAFQTPYQENFSGDTSNPNEQPIVFGATA